jgi:glycosyltransferase involved in cell wall biosynthesis
VRIALAHPTYLPERDGAPERMIRALGGALASRGHEVTLLTGHRGPPGESREDGFRVIRRRRPPERLPMLWRYDDYVVQVPNSLRGLLRVGPDVAHAFSIPDAWAAVQARRLGGPPLVFTLLVVPDREYLVSRRYRLEMLTTVVRRADAFAVPSDEARDLAARLLLREPELVPAAGGEEPAERYEELYERAVRRRGSE